MSEPPHPRVLDHVEKLEIPDFTRFLDELNALRYLRVGLDHLYLQVKEWETKVRGRIPPHELAISGGKDADWMAGVPEDLLACMFHWYSVSAYNYALLVGWVVKEAGVSALAPPEYATAVLPEVSVWRNKVGAHFARAVPRKEDALVVLSVSVFYPVALLNDRFVAAPFPGLTWAGRTGSSKEMRPWSLTEVHEQLRARYWPD